MSPEPVKGCWVFYWADPDKNRRYMTTKGKIKTIQRQKEIDRMLQPKGIMVII
jgi:hypothetical protein